MIYDLVFVYKFTLPVNGILGGFKGLFCSQCAIMCPFENILPVVCLEIEDQAGIEFYQ